jgi:hypothetical protein
MISKTANLKGPTLAAIPNPHPGDKKLNCTNLNYINLNCINLNCILRIKNHEFKFAFFDLSFEFAKGKIHALPQKNSIIAESAGSTQ